MSKRMSIQSCLCLGSVFVCCCMVVCVFVGCVRTKEESCEKAVMEYDASLCSLL